MQYSLRTLQKEFPTERACLDFIFKTRYPRLRGYVRIRGRKEYVNSKGHHLSPLAGTIFHKSSTPLRMWFHAIFLIYVSKNGISAEELSRQLGVSYKTAFRMAHKIRSTMTQDSIPLSGIVEVDETYIGGKHAQKHGMSKKAPVMGMVERGGRIRALVIPHRGTEILLPTIKEHVEQTAHMMSDELHAYMKLPKLGYKHSHVKHGKGHYVRGIVHTNTVEGFWGLFKPPLIGTYRGVSKKYLQNYLDETVWRYNWRDVPSTIAFPELLVSSVLGSL